MKPGGVKYILLFWIGGLLCSGCQDETTYEYYGDLLETPAGLILVQEEHEVGWKEATCSHCHVTGNFHATFPGRTSSFDMEQIRAYVEQAGPSSCSDCHGNNGVE